MMKEILKFYPAIDNDKNFHIQNNRLKQCQGLKKQNQKESVSF